ncbi:hmt2, partial [Symbiodinium necroappetens]
NSPLANGIGFVDVDKETCQHTQFSNVFSLGDCSSLPTSKTYSAISAQAPVVVHNVLAMLDSKPQNATAAYDGYTACPVLVGGNKLMLAEFNGYTM